jgi:hypothetical protein
MIAIPHDISPEESLSIERRSPIRHGYLRGLVYAMAGGFESMNWPEMVPVASQKHTLREGKRGFPVLSCRNWGVIAWNLGLPACID